MKNFIFLLILSSCLLSCGVHRINSNYFPYNDGVSFSVHSTSNERVLEDMHYTTYITKKGTRFKRVILRFQNDTSHEQILGFEEFYLLDDNNNKYIVEYAMQVYKVSGRPTKMKHQLKAGDNKLFALIFVPPFPKDQKVTRLLVKDDIVTF